MYDIQRSLGLTPLGEWSALKDWMECFGAGKVGDEGATVRGTCWRSREPAPPRLRIRGY
jgi:hypothetical protein